MTIRQKFIIFSVVMPLLIIAASLYWVPAIWAFVILVPIIGIGLVDMFQTRHTLRRLYPVLGHFRFMLESVRKEICLLYTSPSPRDKRQSRMPSSA